MIGRQRRDSPVGGAGASCDDAPKGVDRSASASASEVTTEDSFTVSVQHWPHRVASPRMPWRTCYSARMRPQLRRIVWNVLAMWGIASLLAVIAVAGFLAYSFASNKPRLDRATTRDVRFVLNWPGLGDDRIERVVHSYESTVHLNGDHFIAYEVRVTSLTVSELSSEHGRWVRGDRMDALMKDAVQFVTEAWHEAPWLPSAAELSTDKYYVWRWRVEVNERVSAAELIFARPADRTIFYASLQV